MNNNNAKVVTFPPPFKTSNGSFHDTYTRKYTVTLIERDGRICKISQPKYIFGSRELDEQVKDLNHNINLMTPVMREYKEYNDIIKKYEEMKSLKRDLKPLKDPTTIENEIKSLGTQINDLVKQYKKLKKALEKDQKSN